MQILTGNPANNFKWLYLYHGGRYAKLWQDPTTSTNVLGGSFYTFNAGSNWLDVFHGASIQPDFSAYAAGTTPYDPKKYEYHPSEWEYTLPYSDITTPPGFMDAADVARPVLKGAALVGSFIPPIAGPSIAASIFLNGADSYAAGASWG
ncbi:MAG TPA: hypothetical protein VG269_29455 [Tepidisphaeraceae bacterium]|nr:hypothetical protein [Tepidisphaeraceae bacterium]